MEANTSNATVRLRAAAVLCGSATVLGATAAAWHPTTRTTAGDPTGLVVVAAAWAAWVLTLYLAFGTAVTATTHLGVGPRALARLAPRSLRRCVEAAVGASAAAAVCLTPAVAFADAPAPAPVQTASPLDWPGMAPAVVANPVLVGPLVVRPGDSLWSLTARQLGAHASTAQIAATWPQLYAANRHAIGPDPDLIHPGQRLVPPTSDGRTS